MTSTLRNGLPQDRMLWSAPWDPVVVRRGDALGLRAFTDVLADALAPDINNRIHDARWVTILSWCLARSHEAYHKSGGRSLLTRRDQRARYSWLRPLELLWVARTMELAPDDWRGRQLPGQRRVREWLDDGDKDVPRIGLSEEQFRRYRNTGIYGGYRLGFRRWPGMSIGKDGYSPSARAHALAEHLDGKLSGARPSWRLFAGDDDGDGLSSRSVKLARGAEDRFWVQKWPEVFNAGKNADVHTLPRPRDEHAALLEAEILAPVLFGKDPASRRRRDVAEAVLEADGDEHQDVCAHLGRTFKTIPAVQLLPTFSRLADAAMNALFVVSRALAGKTSVPLSRVLEESDAKEVARELVDAREAWLKRDGTVLRHIDTVDVLAARLQNAQAENCYAPLLEHHELSGGGLRWFVLRGKTVEARSPASAVGSLYRFRLFALCRLAVQCGVIDELPEGVRHAADAELLNEGEIEDESADDGDGEGA
ncbi:MAG: hypothetical protein HYS27_23030 [Deltaproteobacteria bacterium]|nr:hypothetical protein [Deltaproteobacteria bacterium]